MVRENKSSEELIHNPTTAVHQQQRPSSKLERMKLDEMKLRKQRRLTVRKCNIRVYSAQHYRQSKWKN